MTERPIKGKTIEIQLPDLRTEDRGHDRLAVASRGFYGLGFTSRVNWEQGGVIAFYKTKGSDTTMFLEVEELEKFALQVLALVEYRKEHGLYNGQSHNDVEVSA